MARHPEPTAVPARIATEARKRLNASASSSDEDVDFSPDDVVVVVVSIVSILKRGGRNGGNFNVPFLLIDVFSVALVFVLVWKRRRRRFFHSCIVSPFCCVGFVSKKGIE